MADKEQRKPQRLMFLEGTALLLIVWNLLVTNWQRIALKDILFFCLSGAVIITLALRWLWPLLQRARKHPKARLQGPGVN